MELHVALETYGLVFSSLDMAEEIHRCATKNKPHKKNGWYIIFDNGRGACFGNWENGEDRQTWRDESAASNGYDFSKIEQKIRLLDQKKELEKEATANQAIEYFDLCARDGYSDYLKNKAIYPHGARFDGNILVIPCQDAAGKIWSCQKIYNDGSKYFMTGGRIKGCYYLISGSRNINKDEQIIVCEGFATGAAIHQATKLPVVVAFNAGNLKPVADSLIFRNITIAADNDQSTVGETYAKSSGYPYVMPDIVGWDFSDVYLQEKSLVKYFPSSVAHTSIEPHGLVKAIADWITATAIRPQPKLSLAAAITFVALIKGHRYATSTDLRSNFLALCLAPSAGGKEHPQNCIIRLIKSCALEKHLIAEPTSGTAFLRSIVDANRCGLWVLDEIGRFLGNVMDKNSKSFQREVIDYIIKSFSKANSLMIGKQYANPKINPRIDIESPHFCCVGFTVREKIIEACKSTDIIDGFLNRWIVFDVEARTKENMDLSYANNAVPKEVIDAVSASIIPINYDEYGIEIIKTINYSPEAADIMRSYRNNMEEKLMTTEYPINTLYARSTEHVAKIAMIMCEGDLIVCEDVNFAINMVEDSNKAILKFVGMISDNQFEGDYIKVREIIKKLGSVSKSTLTRKTQFIIGGSKRRDEIIKSLVESNTVAEQQQEKETHFKFIG